MDNLKYVEIINKCQNLNGLILVLKRLMDEELLPTELRDSFLEDLINQEDIRKTILKLFSKALIANPLVFNMPEIVKFMEIDKVDGTLSIHAFNLYYYNALSYNFEDLITSIFLTIEDLNLQSIIKPDKESWFEIKIKKEKERIESGYEHDFLNIWDPKENPNAVKEDNMHIQISSDSDFKNVVFDGVVPEVEQDKHKQLEELFLKVRKHMSKRNVQYGRNVVSKNKPENLKWVSRDENVINVPLGTLPNNNPNVDIGKIETMTTVKEIVDYIKDMNIDLSQLSSLSFIVYKYREIVLREYLKDNYRKGSMPFKHFKAYQWLLIIDYKKVYPSLYMFNTYSLSSYDILSYMLFTNISHLSNDKSELSYLSSRVKEIKSKTGSICYIGYEEFN